MVPTIPLSIAVSLGVCVAWPGQAAERSGEQITPLLLAVHDAPVPFNGSDGHTHLVYELWITNFSSGDATLGQVDVLGDGNVLATLDAAAIAARLQPAGRRDARDTLSGGATSLLFVHLTLGTQATVPARVFASSARAHRGGAARLAADDAQRRRCDRRPTRRGGDRRAATRRTLRRGRFVL